MCWIVEPDVPVALPRRAPNCARETCDQKEIRGTLNPRTTTTSVAGRSVAMRRLRRRAASSGRLYCSTNGCTSYLTVDTATGTASCEICGYTRRLH
jgi:hypothetical protein